MFVYVNQVNRDGIPEVQAVGGIFVEGCCSFCVSGLTYGLISFSLQNALALKFKNGFKALGISPLNKSVFLWVESQNGSRKCMRGILEGVCSSQG